MPDTGKRKMCDMWELLSRRLYSGGDTAHELLVLNLHWERPSYREE